jgi:hypothetical protein
MSRVMYLVAATEAQGVKDAMSRGWERIALTRFATPDKDDVRVVWRINDMIPTAGGTFLYKGSDYESGPDSEFEMKRWAGANGAIGEKAAFDRFVESGEGMWME